MIQCPICQMMNDEQSRFCAECGARVSAPGPQGNQGQSNPPVHSAPPSQFGGAPPQFGGGTQPQMQPPQPQMQPPQPQMQPPQPQMQTPQPQMQPPQPQMQQPASSAGQSDQQQSPPSAPPRKLRSPLLAAEEFDEEPDFGNAPRGRAPSGGEAPQGRKGFSSPLLGGAGAADYSESAPQGKPGRGGRLGSPLLGGSGAGGDDYYDDEPSEPRGGGMRSPLLGGGSGGGAPGGGGAPKLRSRMLSGGGSGGGNFEEYYDEEDDPYADEDNPNVLRSPLLSSRVPVEPERRAKPQPQPPNVPGQAAATPPGQSPYQYNGAGQPPQQYQQQPYQNPAPQPAPQPVQPPVPQQQPYAQPPQPTYQPQPQPSPQFGGPSGFDALQQAGFGAPPAPSSQGFQPIQPIQPIGAIEPMQDPGNDATSSLLAAAGFRAIDISSEPSADVSSSSVQSEQGDFPDMSRYRREDAASGSTSSFGAPPAANVTPAIPVPVAPPEPAPVKEKERPAEPKRRGSSKLLGEDPPQDDYPQEDFGGGGRSASKFGGQPSYGAPAQGGSPIPKMLGGVIIVLALMKLPNFLAYAPQYLQQAPMLVLDMAVSILALILVGVALLMSRN